MKPVLLIVVVASMATLAAGATAGAAGRQTAAAPEAAATTTPTSPTTTVPSTVARTPSAEDRRLERELGDLASAWASAGGTYGYPFWDRARQRWQDGEISASLFREYVSGYRDRMRLGCQLVDGVDTSSGVADDTHELVSHACDERVAGLESQQRWLDELIDQPVADPSESADQVAADSAQRDERLAKLEADAQEHLQRSFRDTRRAMNLAQAELDAVALDRLPEDAFI